MNNCAVCTDPADDGWDYFCREHRAQYEKGLRGPNAVEHIRRWVARCQPKRGLVIKEASVRAGVTELVAIGRATSNNDSKYALFVLSNEEGPLITVYRDGTTTFGPMYTADETAKLFWQAIGACVPNRCSKCQCP